MTPRGMRHPHYERWLLPIATLLLALLAAWPLLNDAGLINTRGGGDSPFLLQRLHQLETALRDGHFPVRWMPDANYGYGYPFYNFYAPLSIYIALAFRLLGFSYVGAIKAAQLAGFLVAAGGMYRLATGRFHSRYTALLVATAYTYAPFHLVNVYVRGDSLAEFWAMAWYPIILLAMEHLFSEQVITRRQTFQAVAALGVAYAALTLSHNISALIFSPFVLLYGLFKLATVSRAERLAKFGWLAAGALLGLALSAWFWLPALAETSLAQTGPVTEGYFSFRNHFRGRDLVQTTWQFDYNVADGGAFRMGLLQAILALGGIGGLIWSLWQRRPQQPLIWFALVTAATATFMITPASTWFWEHLPLVDFTQFPWRFLSVQAFGLALLFGAIPLGRYHRHLALLATFLIVLLNLNQLKTDHILVPDSAVSADSLAAYEWFTGNIGTTVSAEYLAPTVAPRPYASSWLTIGDRNQISFLQGDGTFALLERATAHQSWQVTILSEEATLVFPLMLWPGWTGRSGSTPLTLTPAPGSGLAMVTLPAGEHTITFELTLTRWRWIGQAISLAGLLFMLLFVASLYQHPSLPRFIIGTVAALILLAVVGRFSAARVAEWSNPSWDFAQRGYLHAAPNGIHFAEGVTLERYQFESEQLRAGETVTLHLTWENLPEDAAVTLELVTPGSLRHANAPILASVTEAAAQPAQTLSVTLSENVPAGPLLPRLTIHDANNQPIAAMTDTGETRGPLYLTPIQIQPAPSKLPPSERSLDVTLSAMPQPSAQALTLQLGWWTMHPLGNNYNVSLRVTDGTGAIVSQLDTQPGYGYLPTTSWTPQSWTHDWLTLPLTIPAESTGPFAVTARLYDVATENVVLTKRLGELTGAIEALQFEESEVVYQVPAGITPLNINMASLIQLEGYTLAQSAEQLDITLYWRAAGNGLADYRHFIHLIDIETGAIVAQHDAQPRNNSYPTNQWTLNEVVADEAVVELEGVPAGRYRVVVGLYHLVEDAFVRLDPFDRNGTPLPEQAVPLPDVTIPAP